MKLVISSVYLLLNSYSPLKKTFKLIIIAQTGWRTYRRPDEKSGGHGVGWSPITPYTFDVPQEWEEVPVSIADLGGTEIDLRFGNAKEGRAIVVVAPVLRFTAGITQFIFFGNLKYIFTSRIT